MSEADENLVIFVVDDEQDVQWLFKQRFRKEVRAGKIDLKFAFSGDEALEQLEAGNLPDLILSDINMPGMTGLELLKSIKAKYPQARVIMVTAYGDDHNFRTARAYGADDYFTKPIDFSALKAKLDAV